ncbi:MAG: hypothetical protein GX781_03000 [Clostridiales bacterium]|nr:hypothetical protein [Clostridiales bacterium]
MDIKNQTTKEKLGGKLPMILSKLWVFLSLNYILSDLLSNMEASVLRGLLEGNIGGIPMTQGFLLLAGLSLEIPFMMVVLSAILPYKTNRFLNIGAAILMILYQAASFFIGSDTTLHYIFFSAVEILGNIVILLLAARWRR